MTFRLRKRPTESKMISSAEIYKMALDTRNLEINLFWQRCNYFLILNSALAYTYINLDDGHLAIPSTALGFLVCFFWYRVALGSKYWQERWEAKLSEVERLFKSKKTFPSDIELFTTNWKKIRDEVAVSLHKSERSLWESMIASQILTKPSVTQAMMYLVLMFCMSWMGVFLYEIYKLTESIVK